MKKSELKLNDQVSIEAVAKLVEKTLTHLFDDCGTSDAVQDSVLDLYGLLYPGAIRPATQEEAAKKNAENAKYEREAYCIELKLHNLSNCIFLLQGIIDSDVMSLDSIPNDFRLISRKSVEAASMLTHHAQDILDDLNAKYE